MKQFIKTYNILKEAFKIPKDAIKKKNVSFLTEPFKNFLNNIKVTTMFRPIKRKINLKRTLTYALSVPEGAKVKPIGNEIHISQKIPLLDPNNWRENRTITKAFDINVGNVANCKMIIDFNYDIIDIILELTLDTGQVLGHELPKQLVGGFKEVIDTELPWNELDSKKLQEILNILSSIKVDISGFKTIPGKSFSWR